MKSKIYILILLIIGLALAVVFIQINKPIELVELSGRASYLDTTQVLEKEASVAVERLILDAEKDGMCLVVVDGHRTQVEQARLYEKYGANRTKKPGESEHETGRAIDFGGCPMTDGKRDDGAERLELRKDFKELPEYQWLVENAHNYKLIQTYKGNGEIMEEPWHWFYNK